MCFLENKSEPLKEDESKAVDCLQSFFSENLVEHFQELLPSLKEKSELYVDFSIAHNILSPLTDDCMLNERHRDYLGLGWAESCKFFAKLNVPSTVHVMTASSVVLQWGTQKPGMVNQT